MSFKEMVDYIIRLASRYGVTLEEEEVKRALNNIRTAVHQDLGEPKAIWQSTSSKPSTADIIDLPDDCIEVLQVFLDGKELVKVKIEELRRLINEPII